MTDSGPREILIEYVRVGVSLRVTAVDVNTGTEVTFQAPASARQPDLQRLAANKLNYVLSKQK